MNLFGELGFLGELGFVEDASLFLADSGLGKVGAICFEISSNFCSDAGIIRRNMTGYDVSSSAVPSLTDSDRNRASASDFRDLLLLFLGATEIDDKKNNWIRLTLRFNVRRTMW